jgi:hypothetical protein
MGSETASVKIHLEVLTSRQALVLKAIGPVFSRRGFYLAGGTGLALHLGHRRSIDLDFFSGKRLGDMLVLADSLRDEGVPIVISTVGRGTLHGTIRGIRTTILEYRYVTLKPPRHMGEFGCALASLDDIAAMKLSAIAQRGSKKDFIDVYALLTKHASLDGMLNVYRRRYRLRDTFHVLQAMTYFDEADEQRTPRMLWNIGWSAMKRRIQECVMETVQGRAKQR